MCCRETHGCPFIYPLSIVVYHRGVRYCSVIHAFSVLESCESLQTTLLSFAARCMVAEPIPVTQGRLDPPDLLPVLDTIPTLSAQRAREGNPILPQTPLARCPHLEAEAMPVPWLWSTRRYNIESPTSQDPH
jgi:hypothetical protein